jgi:hypothetical protein
MAVACRVLSLVNLAIKDFEETTEAANFVTSRSRRFEALGSPVLTLLPERQNDRHGDCGDRTDCLDPSRHVTRSDRVHTAKLSRFWARSR